MSLKKMSEKVSEGHLNLNLCFYNLPGDIYDNIAAFLGNPDLFIFLTLSRHITISSYLLRDRQRARWKKCSAKHLAIKGDLAGLQYLFLHRRIGGLGTTSTTKAMDFAAAYGHLAVVEFLHSVASPYTNYAMDWAAKYGHLAVVGFLEKSLAKNVDSFV